MALLQPFANFKYEFFWGVLIPENSNFASSSSSNVVSINHVLVRVLLVEVSNKKTLHKERV
jgi:hypothetical protein